MLFRDYKPKQRSTPCAVLISLARVMLFRDFNVKCRNDILKCLNLSCESNAFQGASLAEEGVSPMLS